jgi:type IV pilus assembly protein PilA
VTVLVPEECGTALARSGGMSPRTVRRSDAGFTLIELLVVTSIIGILASLAIPQFAAYRARGYDAKVASAVRHVATGMEAYYISHHGYTTNVGDLDGMVLDDVEITLSSGNSGDINSSFKIHGEHPAAGHTYDWVSDPAPGDPNFIVSD